MSTHQNPRRVCSNRSSIDTTILLTNRTPYYLLDTTCLTRRLACWVGRITPVVPLVPTPMSTPLPAPAARRAHSQVAFSFHRSGLGRSESASSSDRRTPQPAGGRCLPHQCEGFSALRGRTMRGVAIGHVATGPGDVAPKNDAPRPGIPMTLANRPCRPPSHSASRKVSHRRGINTRVNSVQCVVHVPRLGE